MRNPTRMAHIKKGISKELYRRLKLEKMLTDITHKAVTSSEAADFQQTCLQIMGTTLGVSRVYIFEHRQTSDTMDNTYEWVDRGVEPQKKRLQSIAAETVPWWIDQLKRNKVICFEDIEAIPSEPEKEILRRQLIKSILVVPLYVAKKYYGFIGFDECRKKRQWQDEDVAILLSISRIMAGFIERVLSEQALFKERHQLRSIFEGINQIVHIVDPLTHEVLYANEAAQGIFHGHLVGQKCYRALHGRDTPCTPCNCLSAPDRNNQTHNREIYNAQVDRHFLNSDRIIQWPIDGRDVRLTISVDITDRKRAEQALAESERKYRQLFEMESDAIFLIDNGSGNLLEVNPACESLYGYSREQLLTMKNTDLSAEPHETRKATLSALPSVPVRYHRKKDGTVFPVEITARHFSWKGRGVHVAAIRDITLRTEAQYQKDELEAQLRQAQKMESIGTLAGGIAHDFNNMLSAIMGYTELAMLHESRSYPFHSDLEEVLKAAQRAKNLVARILAFSRQSRSVFVPIQIGLIVKETIKMLRPTLPSCIEIDTRIASDAVATADANQIQQVVMNLCTNAYHAMKPCGGRLRIELEARTLDETFASKHGVAPGPYVMLRVADTGAGMDQKTMQRVFEPYFTTKQKGEGTGLGLSVVYGIIKTHKGFITVESELARGSCFCVYLPQLERRTSTVALKDDALLPMGNERVLLVDDEPIIGQITKGMLEHIGYQVTVRSSTLEALELFQRAAYRFDLVLADFNMPHVSGNCLSKQMVQIRPDIPVILCTGFSNALTEQEMKAAGIRAVALKPLLMADLAKLIRDVLDGPPT